MSVKFRSINSSYNSTIVAPSYSLSCLSNDYWHSSFIGTLIWVSYSYWNIVSTWCYLSTWFNSYSTCWWINRSPIWCISSRGKGSSSWNSYILTILISKWWVTSCSLTLFNVHRLVWWSVNSCHWLSNVQWNICKVNRTISVGHFSPGRLITSLKIASWVSWFFFISHYILPFSSISSGIIPAYTLNRRKISCNSTITRKQSFDTIFSN